MKIRTDFVTNSSSSSFILIGNNVNLGDIDLKKNIYIAVGRWLSDGRDVIDLDQEIYDYILTRETMDKLSGKSYSEFEFYQVYKFFSNEDDDRTITAKQLADAVGDVNTPFKIVTIDKDYHCSCDVSDIEDRYWDDNRKDDYDY